MVNTCPKVINIDNKCKQYSHGIKHIRRTIVGKTTLKEKWLLEMASDDLSIVPDNRINFYLEQLYGD